jgi:hypothetical protein
MVLPKTLGRHSSRNTTSLCDDPMALDTNINRSAGLNMCRTLPKVALYWDEWLVQL